MFGIRRPDGPADQAGGPRQQKPIERLRPWRFAL
jgi:hypothetical protein